MIIFQQVIAADTKYNFPNQPNLTLFDLHNDSPFNVGISFGADTGIGNADYFTTAHGILFGIGPMTKKQSVAGVKWNGTIYIYTQTPGGGGGGTNLSDAPASQVTVIGYATGYNPVGTVSMARMVSVPNQVSTVGGTANLLVNDSFNSGSQIIETRVPGDLGPGFAVMNNGHVQIGFGSAQGNLDLGYPSQITFEAGPGQQSGGNPGLFLDVNGVLHINTNGGLHQVQIDGNTTINFDGANGAINMATNSQTLNGGTGGTATLWQDFTGTVKRAAIFLNAFQTGASAQTFTFVTPFTTWVQVWTGNIGTSANSTGVSLLHNGVAQNVNMVTALSATGGTATGGTVFYGLTFLDMNHPVEKIQFNASWSSSHNGSITIIGV